MRGPIWLLAVQQKKARFQACVHGNVHAPFQLTGDRVPDRVIGPFLADCLCRIIVKAVINWLRLEKDRKPPKSLVLFWFLSTLSLHSMFCKTPSSVQHGTFQE